MDGTGSTGLLRDRERFRPQAPQHSRAPSRSSTSTSNTRTTPRSNNSSSSRLASSPPPRPSTVVHPSQHRQHHSTCRTPTTPRAQSAAPIDNGAENSSSAAMSSFLQERLQRRREEAERNAAARLAQETSSSAGPSRTAQSSPAKTSSTDGRRPQSSGGGSERSDPNKKKGMGAKEMEAASPTVSTLHKQNFDLKLELYHRRERQNALEERADRAEAEKGQLQDINDQLLEELEKRDKAVQEAVQMIVVLEAQVEKLMDEREMVRQVEQAGYLRLDEVDAALSAPKPKSKMADLAQMEQDAKVLNRQPSFISEKTGSTANLRKVYLGASGSVLSLPKVAEGTPVGGDHGRSTSMNMRSPSLSDLSESSFTSVYGHKEAEDDYVADMGHEPATEYSPRPQARDRAVSSGSVTKPPRARNGTPTQTPRPRSNSAARPNPANFQSMNSVIEQGSPVQRPERMERRQPPHTDPAAWARNSAMQHQQPPPPPPPPPQLRKDDKRGGLRKVVTDAPGGRSNFDHAMPPTPDTISTSTLRRYKNSNDTLVHQQGTIPEDSRAFTTASSKQEMVAVHEGGAPVSQIPLTAGLNRPDHFFDARDATVQRPRSASETTTSRRKGSGWNSDEDDVDDNASVHSLESSLDIWLQQGKEPKQQRGGGGSGDAGSPDLFGFPSRSQAWQAQASYRQGAPLDDEGASLQWPDPLDDLMPIQQELFGGSGPTPPTPNRRSSLHAQTKTGSSSSATPQRHVGPLYGRIRRSLGRRNSEDSQTKVAGQAFAQSPQQQNNRGHYPPLSRPGTATPRNHRRINSLWRRSLGASGPAASPTTSNPPESSTAGEGTGKAGDASSSGARSNSMNVGTPSWMQRGKTVDEEARATPPPIQRQPRRSSVVDSEGASLADHAPMTPSSPLARDGSSTPKAYPSAASEGYQEGGGASLGDAAGGQIGNNNNNMSNSRRKWLPGFGRASSQRNRA